VKNTFNPSLFAFLNTKVEISVAYVHFNRITIKGIIPRQVAKQTKQTQDKAKKLQTVLKSQQPSGFSYSSYLKCSIQRIVQLITKELSLSRRVRWKMKKWYICATTAMLTKWG
jgi:hypothetical protein